MPASIPIARSKTAALARVLDSIPKGYRRYTSGTVVASKAASLAAKFHAKYGIGLSPAQRLTRKSKGLANCLLVMHWPENAERAEWLLMATSGKGLEREATRDVEEKPHLIWLGYELVRHANRGKVSWTWRRTKSEMRDLYALLTGQLNRRHFGAVTDTLERIARQPGFHGVREQSWQLFQYARQHGYEEELPYLFYLQKVSHGDPLVMLNHYVEEEK